MLNRKNIISPVLTFSLLAGIIPVSVHAENAPVQQYQFETGSMNGKLRHLASYHTGLSSSDGGVAEIVAYNSDNHKMYLVNGAAQSVDIVSTKKLSSSGKQTELKLEKRLQLNEMGKEYGFSVGDITSVAVNTKEKIVALAVQGKTYTDGGYIVAVDYNGNYMKHFSAGVQPDMVTFSHDNKYLLSANEGEPREGYNAPGAVNPKGSITVIDLKKGIKKAQADTIGFEAFDSEKAKAKLIADGVLLKPGTKPSEDLEPEYIAVSENNKYAYVSLQEANAIAVFDLKAQKFTSIKGLGFKDHNLPGNELDALKDGKVLLENQDLHGVYMPDGIASAKIKGKDYIFTANEGDAREWGTKPYSYADIAFYTLPGTQYKIDRLLNSEREGLDADKTYILGARSFSIWEANTMKQVFDSGSDFERITAERYPQAFNSSHGKTELDSRSGKKGPEPEDVKVMKIKGKTYAFIGLERIGGIMVYDVTDVHNAKFYDYINLRDFNGSSVSTSGSLGPEGISLVEAKDSPTKTSLVLVANEVSGNVDMIEIR
ncbi:Ig domain-containing protein [Bacillus lacus]|uniref:Ig domain-containing protein n=1 Tax=Metabacillus lacus TaxID=1983721 RepID=A0A7X2J2F1_9BACI|nr:choice-of-anchor I family protein [Metabacillus lacus]MRX74079.1 Ig domain-containing protein [Metabacillus lacus]